MRKCLAAVGLLSAITGVMTLTLISNDTTPVSGKGLKLSCLTLGKFTNSEIHWFKSGYEHSTCFPLLRWLCSTHFFASLFSDFPELRSWCIDKQCIHNSLRYSFTADSKGAYVYINSLIQALDSGKWGCENWNGIATIEIEVYTIPSGLSITQNPDQDVDLSVNSVVLQCKTTGCTYPMPKIKWIFKDQATLSETEYANVSPKETEETCGSSERVYTSTLPIPQYTFTDKKNGKFYCRIEYPDPSRNIISSLSKNIRFADAPDVIVKIIGSTVVGSTVVLMCTAQGEAPQYTFNQWIHRVGQTEVRRLNGVNTSTISILTLSYISIQDMGSYFCAVDNSITGLDGQLYQTGDTSVYVQGRPVIGETGSIFTGEIGKSTSLEIPFYSNSSTTTVKFIKHLDSFVMSNTSDVSIYIFPSIITLTFYTEKVMIPGQKAVILFRNVTDKDFDNYVLIISNEKGNVTMGFDFIDKDSIYTALMSKRAPVCIGVGGAVGCFLYGCIVTIIAFIFRRQLYDSFFTPPELSNEPVGISVVAAVVIGVVCVLIGCIWALSS